MRRREALKALVLITLPAGCGDARRGVRVVAVWSGWELAQFRRVMAGFSGGRAWRVSVLSAGDDLPALLANEVAATAAPDVAMVPQPGLVEDNRRRLVPLPAPPEMPADWQRLLTFDGRLYGVWFKVTHKSLVWYRPDRLDEPPQTWEEWVELCRRHARDGRPPLAVGAADGWSLTDWFENVLLSIDPVTYRNLVDNPSLWRHPSVARALTRLGEMWSIPGVFPGGPTRALVSQFDGAVIDVFRRGRGTMVAGGDTAYPIIRRYGAAPATWFRFPGHRGRRPLLVGGDAAVLLAPGSDGGQALIAWLAGAQAAQAARPWAGQGGFLSLDPRVAGYPAGLAALAEEIRDPSVVTFDLSDQLGGRLAGGDGRGTWKILTDFFAAVAERPAAVGPAVARAVDAFDQAARRRA